MKTKTTCNRVLNDGHQRLCIVGVFLLIFIALVTSSRANILVWTGGGGANGNWNMSANWGSAGIPGNGDTVVFQGVAGLNSTNNIPNLTLNQIRFISGGFNINGSAFTLTNSLVATNFTGSINIYNTLTNRTADLFILVSNSITVTLYGNLNGPVGVVKAGLGTLTYNGPNDDSYTGTTLVSAGTLQLNVNGFNAFLGPLVVGDGSGNGSPTVRNLQNQEIPDNGQVTVNLNGLYDLNNSFETIGALTIQGSTVNSEAGTLTINGNITVLGSSVEPTIYGNLAFTSKATIAVQSSPFYPNFYLIANINDGGFGLVITNLVAGDEPNPSLNGSNTITGPLSIYNTVLDDGSGMGLGATNPVTITSGQLVLRNSNYTNKSLTIQGNNSYLDSLGPCTWAGPIVLVGNQGIYSYDDGPLNLAGPISGTGNLTVETFDTNFVMVLSGNASNSFAGDLWMQVGTIEFAKTAFDGAIPNNLILGWNNGGSTYSATNRYLASNQINNNGTVTLSYGSVMDLNNFVEGVGSLVLNAGTKLTTGTGRMDMYLPGTIITPGPAGSGPTISGTLGETVNCTFLATNDLNIPANILSFGNYNLVKAGPANLYLSGANTYTGPTLVQQGWLWAENPLALGATTSGTIVSSGATLGLSGNITITNEPLTLNGPGESSVWGSLDVESGINTWMGPITNNGSSTLDSWNVGSELHINGPISGPGSLELFGYSLGGGTHFFDGSLSNSYAGLTTVDSGATLLLNKTALNGALPGNLVINSGGTTRLGGALQMQKNTGILINGGGLFDTGINWDQFDTLQGSGTLNFGTNGYLELGWNNGTSTFNGPMTGTGYTYGGYTLAKYGTGTFTMNGNSSFPFGAFRVWGGTFFENGLAPQVPVIVNSATTFGGSGTVNTITGNGNIAPGNYSAGILTCTSNLTFSSTGSYSVDLTGPNPGTGYDQLNVSGTNVLANAGLFLNLEFVSPVSVGQQFTIINNSGTVPISGTFLGDPEGAVFNNNGFSAKLSYVGGGGKNVVLTLLSVPGSTGSSTVTAGDGSHGLDPNDCNNFTLSVSNLTATTMSSVSATLSTTTEGVVITQPYANYPNISGHGTGTNITPFQISALPSFVCGTPINLQLSVSSSLGSFTVSYVLQTGEAAVVPSRYDITGNVAIPDVGTVDSTNVVSGFVSTPLSKVVVSLYITHPFDSDLTNISLISPDGTTVLLSSANGGSGQNYGSGLSPDSLRTTFDDAAGTAITAGTAPFVGTFRPQSPLSAYAENFTANGNWHLHIADGFGGSLGTLRGWSLFLYGTTCNSGSGPCDYCMTSISGTVTNTSLIQTNRISRNVVAASCGAAKSWPGGFDLLGRHYDIYAFTNTTASDACVTAVLASSGDLQAGIYLNAFSPTNIQANYLADSGNSTSGNINNPQSCSATIPSGTVFYVTVDEITPNAGGAYTLQLSGLPCPPPTLNIQPVAGNKARLYWNTSGGGYVLESVSNLTATAWGGVTNEPMVSGGTYNVTNSTVLPITNRFYRLHMP